MKTSLPLVLILALAGCANVLDSDKPRLYACDRAEGLNSCPDGWRCGLSGYCQSPVQLLPYACETTEDCSGTWHCGPDGVCFDRDAPRDRPCRAELETSVDTSDCAPGWRCGREVRGQVCHPLDAGAGYLCASDSDCEAGWRCGNEGACVDVASQGLRVQDVTLGGRKMSPRLPTRPELLQLVVHPWLSGSSLENRLVATEGSTLSITTNSVNLNDFMPSVRASAQLVRAPHALAATDEHVFVTDSMGLVDYFDALDGGNPVLVEPLLANAELRLLPSTSISREELASFSGTTVGICGRGQANLFTCDPTKFQFAELPAAINDVSFYEQESGSNTPRYSVLAATAQGAFFAPRGGGSFLSLDGGAVTAPVWRPMALPGLSDPCSGAPKAIDRITYDERLKMLAVTTDQDRQLSFFNRTFTSQSIARCSDLEVDPEYGPCAACGPDERLVQLASGPDSDFGDHTVTTLCELTTADGGAAFSAYRHHARDAGCALEPMSLPASVRSGYRVARETLGLQGVDSVGQPRSCPQLGCDTMLFAPAPDRVAGGPALFTVHSDDIVVNGAHQSLPSGRETPLGIERLEYQRLFIAGSVIENPDWMLGSSGSPQTLGDQAMVVQSMRQNLVENIVRPIALLNRSSDLLPRVQGVGLIDATPTKAFSTITTDADGAPWLIVGAGDRIWAEDARLLVEDPDSPRTINVKAVPLPSAEIQSLAFAAFDRGDAGTGPILEGFTVEQNRLFRVRVHTAQLWLPDEIRIGESGIVPVAVWMEGKRGRVGTLDGRVFGLPIPVVLSPTIPEAPLPTVLNYGSLCGQAFALSSTALYRLKADTQPLGNWERVSLESVQRGLDSFAPHWSPTMHKARVGNVEHLYLFSDTGLTIDLNATCSP